MSKGTPFRKPKDIPVDAPLVPISGRVSEETREFLEAEAARAGHSLSSLVGQVLQDYATWIRNGGKS